MPRKKNVDLAKATGKAWTRVTGENSVECGITEAKGMFFKKNRLTGSSAAETSNSGQIAECPFELVIWRSLMNFLRAALLDGGGQTSESKNEEMNRINIDKFLEKSVNQRRVTRRYLKGL